MDWLKIFRQGKQAYFPDPVSTTDHKHSVKFYTKFALQQNKKDSFNG